jgi:hypothetical protein
MGTLIPFPFRNKPETSSLPEISSEKSNVIDFTYRSVLRIAKAEAEALQNPTPTAVSTDATATVVAATPENIVTFEDIAEARARKQAALSPTLTGVAEDAITAVAVDDAERAGRELAANELINEAYSEAS